MIVFLNPMVRLKPYNILVVCIENKMFTICKSTVISELTNINFVCVIPLYNVCIHFYPNFQSIVLYVLHLFQTTHYHELVQEKQNELILSFKLQRTVGDKLASHVKNNYSAFGVCCSAHIPNSCTSIRCDMLLAENSCIRRIHYTILPWLQKNLFSCLKGEHSHSILQFMKETIVCSNF